jgi:hypothetical protein
MREIHLFAHLLCDLSLGCGYLMLISGRRVVPLLCAFSLSLSLLD